MARVAYLAPALCSSLLLTGCFGGDDGPALHVEPESVAPGGDVVVTVEAPEDDAMTETTSILERAAASGWREVYVIGSSSPKYAEPIGEGTGQDIAMGVGLDPGDPESLDIPADVQPGRYRLVKQVSAEEGDSQYEVAGEFIVE